MIKFAFVYNAINAVWNVYRYPTEKEISLGLKKHDMVWIGADLDQNIARELLQGQAGRLQLGYNGPIENISGHK